MSGYSGNLRSRVFLGFLGLNMLLPVLLWWGTKSIPLNVNVSGMLASVHEFACSLLVFCLLTKEKRSLWKSLLSLSFLSVGIADLTYGVTAYILRIPPPRGVLPLVHEIPYALFSLLTGWAILYRSTQGLSVRERVSTFSFVAIVAGGFFACSYSMILHPFFQATPARPLVLYITATLYAAGQSVFLGGLLISSIRAARFPEFAFWFLFILLIGTDFALRYQDIGGPVPQLSFFEYGWHFAIASLSSIAAWSFIEDRGERLFLSPSRFNSIRVVTASVALVSLTGFLGAMWIIEVSPSKGAPGAMGVQMILLTCSWAFANLAALGLSRIIESRSQWLSREIGHIASLDDFNRLPTGPMELQSIVSALQVMNGQLRQSAEENIKLQSNAVVGMIASQVSHDIRSPLAALEMLVGSIENLPEDQRLLLRGAATRIKDISNGLLQMNRRMEGRREICLGVESQAVEKQSVELISVLIDSITSEKRWELRGKIGVEINVRLDQSVYAAFASIQVTEFKRAISNVLNNAVESLNEVGRIGLSLIACDGRIEIQVCDSGCGIAPELLQMIGRRGQSFGKVGGSGLGLCHARSSVEAWGGDFRIESTLGKGTTLFISLPLALAPVWFVGTLKIDPDSTVLVLDDDANIHHVWDQRFDSLDCHQNRVQRLHFSTLQQVRGWVAANSSDVARTRFLLDYELLGEKETGLDLVEELGIGARSVLVTSHFEDANIRTRCEALGVGLIPKSMVGQVPIEIAEECGAQGLQRATQVTTPQQTSVPTG